jgi:hypothetical protein
VVTRPDTPPGSRPSLLAEGSAAGLMFLAGPAAGYYLGKWLGDWAGFGPAPAWIGAALGLAAAFRHLLRLVARVSK